MCNNHSKMIHAVISITCRQICIDKHQNYDALDELMASFNLDLLNLCCIKNNQSMSRTTCHLKLHI